MKKNKKGRNGIDRAARKAIEGGNFAATRTRLKPRTIQLAVGSLPPTGCAAWLIQQRRFRHD